MSLKLTTSRIYYCLFLRIFVIKCPVWVLVNYSIHARRCAPLTQFSIYRHLSDSCRRCNMADVPSDEFPVWDLLPKKETGVVSWLSKHGTYDGRGTVVAVFDSGVDPAAAGLSVTSTGETKVIERFDCSGSGDVDTSRIVTPADGVITGITGRKLKVLESWKNPSGKWRVGVLYPFQLYPTKLKERVVEHRRTNRWEPAHRLSYARANTDVTSFQAKHLTNPNLTPEEKLEKEELETRVEVLQAADRKFSDVGPAYDCVLFHDGNVWRACIDTSECGELASGTLLGEYGTTREHAHLTRLDEMTVSINVHADGDVLEVVGMCSTHGTHVAAIAAGCFPDEPDKNGIAPGAKVVSLTIGDSRLGGMETGTGLVRACIKVMELCKKYRIDVINMSYGEHAHWSNAGRIGEIMCEVVNRYGVSWVVSAGNNGPALCTVGAPPDIEQPLLIGVGAYVSPEMMSAAYSMRERVNGNAFSWSSRGPAADGGAGVSVCAPGGAVASVARFTLRGAQLMNGTSMAAPHVAGAVATLISGLKAKNLPYSPFSIKRALENSATYLGHVEPWAQGCGLLNVERAFDNLCSYSDQPERDVTFTIQCGVNNGKGVLLRPRVNDGPKDITITVEPQFMRSHEDLEDTQVIGKQIEFAMRLTLVVDASWVSIPRYLDMMNANRPLAVRVDTAALPPGPHFASIQAYDVACIEKGPVFRIPVTVFQPQPLQLDCAGPPVIAEAGARFKPAAIRRHFVVVPLEATWAVLKMSTADKSKTGRFLIHTMQLLPRRSCRQHETQKMINVTSETPALLPFSVTGGVTLEVVIAKYWANIGDMQMDYSVEFHGVKPNFGQEMTFHAAEGLLGVMLSSLRTEEVVPSVTLKYTEQVLRPTESKIKVLGDRDMIPPSRHIYQLINTYTFHLTKATEISPAATLLCNMLYESEFESQMWIIYNTNKQLMAVGDAYPSKYTSKLEKGEYLLKLMVRHDQRAMLEKLQELPVVVQQRLQQPLTLDAYLSQSQALKGGKKFANSVVSSGSLLPLYFAAVPAEKIGRSNITIGQTLTGTVTFAKDELGRRVDSYDVQYVLAEPPKRPAAASAAPPANGKDKDKDKDKKKTDDEYAEALREFKAGWLPKLESDGSEKLYSQLAEESPDWAGAHVAYLNSLDPPTDLKRLPRVDSGCSEVDTAQCERVLTCADKLLRTGDREKLLAYLGIKNDTRSDADKIKLEQEKRKGYIVDALCRRGAALCRLYARAADELARAKQLPAVVDNMNDLLQFADVSDSKVIHYSIWHCYTLKQWGRAVKLLQKLQEERASREVDERLVELYQLLEWRHLQDFTGKSLPVRYPTHFRQF